MSLTNLWWQRQISSSKVKCKRSKKQKQKKKECSVSKHKIHYKSFNNTTLKNLLFADNLLICNALKLLMNCHAFYQKTCMKQGSREIGSQMAMNYSTIYQWSIHFWWMFTLIKWPTFFFLRSSYFSSFCSAAIPTRN